MEHPIFHMNELIPANFVVLKKGFLLLDLGISMGHK